MKIVDERDNVKSNSIDFFPINDLPSKYKLYPENTKISGRRLTVPEVKKLAELNEDNFDIIINQILSVAIEGINIEDLKIPDKLYIILWLRANTYKEPGYVTEFHCSNSACDKDTSYEFQLENLDMIYLKDDFKDSFIVDNNNIKINFESVKDSQDKDEVLKNFKEDIDKEDLTLASNIGTINSKEMTLLDKYNFIRDELNPQDYIKLKQYVKDNEFGFNLMFDAVCKHCGGITPMGISFCREFFIPRYIS